MSNTDTSELLKLCDEVIYATQPGEYTAMTNGEMAKVCEDAAPHLARALKSRLQAEAPTDAEVAEIEKRHADCEAFYAGHGGYRPDWHKDRATLLAKLRARTSEAEAQAPTTVAQASVTEDEPLIDWLIDTVAHCTTGHFDSVMFRNACDNKGIIDRLTVGAPAPTTAAQASVLTEDERAEWKALCYEVLGTTSTDESLIYWCCKSTKLAALLLRFIEPTSTVGAPAPATAPKHAPNCGYWLDLNCSCKLEDNTP